MASIAELLVEQGRVLADARRRRGERRGELVTALGQIPATVVNLRDQARVREEAARRAATQDEAMRVQTEESRAKLKQLNDAVEREAHLSDVLEQEGVFNPKTGEMNLQAALGHAKRLGYIGLAGELAEAAQKQNASVAKAAPPHVIERDPTKDIIDPTTGEVITPGTPKVEPEKPVTFSAPQPAMVNGQRVLVRAGSDGALYDMKGGKIENAQPDVPPQREQDEPLVAIVGPDGQSVLVPRSKAVGKRPANAREQGRPVISGAAERIGEFDTGIGDLGVLRTAISGNKATGTAAKIGTKIPNWATEITGWGADAKSKNAVIMRVKQVIGKTLEGGVLRKEDEEKYKDILPTIGDVASVVKDKLDGLEAAIKRKKENELNSLEDAGYDVSRFRARSVASKGKIRARDAKGVLHEADAGTPLPAGWTLEK